MLQGEGHESIAITLLFRLELDAVPQVGGDETRASTLARPTVTIVAVARPQAVSIGLGRPLDEALGPALVESIHGGAGRVSVKQGLADPIAVLLPVHVAKFRFPRVSDAFSVR